MAANTPIRTPADAINASLTLMGYKRDIGSLFDGSEAAQKALNIYAQARDALLRKFDYDWAQSTVSLTLLKTGLSTGYFPPTPWDPVTYPPPGYMYSYAWPDDCLKVRLVKPAPLFVVNIDPQFYSFQIYNDTGYTPARRTIVSNVPSAVASYTRQVTNPQDWDVAFVDLIIAEMTHGLAKVLLGLEGAKAVMDVDTPARAATAEAESR